MKGSANSGNLFYCYTLVFSKLEALPLIYTIFTCYHYACA